MVPELEKPRVTEIRVRMDCNGCVHKIKKALHGITGIYDLYIDFSQQKITIIGWTEPEKIVKAIKKTRKSATICSHTEHSDQPAQETEPVPESTTAEGRAPPPEQPPEEAAPTPDKERKESPLPPENPPVEEKKPAPEPANETCQFAQPSKPNEPVEIHVIYHHPPDYGYRYAYGHYHQPGVGGEPPQSVHVAHSYNTYEPSPYVTEYTHLHTHYSRLEQHSQLYYNGNNDNGNGNGSGNGNGNGNGNITSMFSEENPNACSII